jgi:hypothetical protein
VADHPGDDQELAMPELKDGTTSEDPRLARLVQFDERSRGYPVIRERAPRLRSRIWDLDKPYVIDQGSEGACVGFGVTNELLCEPVPNRFGGVDVAHKFAMNLYWDAQKIDPWPGGSYPGADPYYEGTSILAGVQVAQSLGYFAEYRWAFGIEDLVLGLANEGPALLGVTWHESMYWPDYDHFIRPSGRVVGGHAIVARGVHIEYEEVFAKGASLWRWLVRSEPSFVDVDFDRSYVTLRNSWGPSYGDRGDCYITLRNLDRLLRDNGEAVFFVDRRSI